MAVTTALLSGKKARIYVSLTGLAADAIIVQSMNSITQPGDSSTTTTDTFDDTPSPALATVGSDTYNIGGLFRPGQVGQTRIRTARQTGATIYLHIYPDGEVGWVQAGTVGSSEWGATPNAFQTWTFTFSASGPKTGDKRDGSTSTDSTYTI